MKHLLLPVIFSIVFTAVRGEPSELKWKNYINRQNIRCLLPDGNYLWIGTHEGGFVRRNCITGEEMVFDKDDGYFSDKITYIVKDSGSIIWAASPYNVASFQNGLWIVEEVCNDNNNIRGLTVDRNGTLWVVCSKGILRRRKDSFERISAFEELIKADEYPITIASGKNDSLIYVLMKNRVECFTVDGIYYKTIDIPFDTPMSICTDNENRLFVAGVDTVGLYDGDMWHFFSVSDSTLTMSVLKVSVSPHGDVWAYGGGDVSVFVENRWELRHKHTYGSGIISTVAPLTKDSAWFGRDYFLALKNPDTLKVISSGTPGGNNIHFVFCDREGTIWTQANRDKGILQFVNGKWSFNDLFYTLGHKTIKMLHTTDSVYWFLQPRNYASYLDNRYGGRSNYILSAGHIPPGSLNDFIENAAGEIWFATSNGVVSTDELMGKWMTYNKDNAGFASNTINTLLLRKDKTLWAGGNDGTLAFFSDSTWTLQTISIKSIINVLAEDSSGTLWIGTKDGVINKNGNNETVYTVSDGLGSNIINAILVDSDNKIWVGTNNGLSYITDGVVKRTFQRPCGIAGNSITSLCQDKDGVLWIGTYSRGISTLTFGTSSVNNNKKKLTRPVSKQGCNTVIKLDKTLQTRNEPAGTYLLNGKRITGMIRKRVPGAANCYIATE